MLLGTFGASLLGNRLAGKGTIRTDEITITTGQDFWFRLDLWQILKYERIIKMNLNFMGFFSRNNSLKVKDGEYVMNLDAYKSIGTHWIALHMNEINIVHFDNFGVQHFPKEI